MHSSLNIGFVSYLNAIPMHLYLQSAAATLHFDVPSALNKALKEGKLDACLSSATVALDEGYEYLPYCIAAKNEILSVNLYVKDTVTDLSSVCIALTSQSNASISLLKVLCHHLWKVTPNFTLLNSPLHSHEAFLLIGDQALQTLHMPGYKVIDLAKSWTELTQLPFVFALFTYKKHTAALDPLVENLETSLLCSEMHMDQVVLAAQKRSSLESTLLRRYYTLCTYRLGEKEREGLNLFARLRKEV
jgi:putative solute-binding protein